MTAEFDWLSLDPDEGIVWSGGPRRVVVGVVAAVAAFVPVTVVAVWPTLAGIALGLALWAATVAIASLYVENVEYVVSSRYVYAKRGILGRRVTQIGLGNIQDTTLRQGVLGTQFDHGTIAFSTAGGSGTQLGFYAIDGPRAVKQVVDEQVAAARRRSKRGESGVERDDVRGAEAAVEEARRLRDVAQRIDRALGDGEPDDAGAVTDGGYDAIGESPGAPPGSSGAGRSSEFGGDRS